MRKQFGTALLLSSLAITGTASAQQFADDVSDFGVWGAATATGNFGFVNPDNPTLSKVKWWAEGQGRFADDASKFYPGYRTSRYRLSTQRKDECLGLDTLGHRLQLPMSRIPTMNTVPGNNSYTPTHTHGGSFKAAAAWKNVLSPTISGQYQPRGWKSQQRVVGGFSLSALAQSVHSTLICTWFRYIVQDEAFVSLNDTDWVPRQGFDQNRFFTGVGYAFTKNITGEIGYMNQYIIRRGANYMGHNLVVNLLANF